MTTLAEKYSGILDRTNRPDPAAEAIRSIFLSGKREQLLSGVDAHGNHYAPLLPQSLKNRQPGPPLVPGGPAARLIVEYRVDVIAAPGRLEVSAGWPFEFVRYLRTGTREMVARDPGGFRDGDRTQALTKLSEFLRDGSSR